MSEPPAVAGGISRGLVNATPRGFVIGIVVLGFAGCVVAETRSRCRVTSFEITGAPQQIVEPEAAITG
ncbi:MAG: hypothetical protein ACT4OT_11830 [Acidobacteriota bacterium]